MTSPSLLLFVCIAFLSTVTATCAVDSDCSNLSYCYSSTCQPSRSIGSTCYKSISSRKQCLDGYCNNTSICEKYIPFDKKCDPVSYPPLYTCEKGNYCEQINNITHIGKCQSTLPNGSPCTMWQACTSQYCDNTKTNAKTGTCATNPIVDLIVAAGMGILTIILIVIGSAIACCIGVCCWCYKMGRRPPIIFGRAPTVIATTIPMQSNPHHHHHHHPHHGHQHHQHHHHHQNRYHQLHDHV